MEPNIPQRPLVSHPLITHAPGEVISLPPRLLPSAAYYALIASYPEAGVGWGGRYDRTDKDTHRFRIADTRGPLTLTVPIAKPQGGARWADVELSDHGRWQETMPTALESAYGRTPFFEFYADRLLPIIANARGGDKLIDFASALDSAVCGILGLTSHRIEHSATEAVRTPGAPLPELRPYWQVRAGTLGFIPGLSILDLIFNLGPEAPLLLRAATR